MSWGAWNDQQYALLRQRQDAERKSWPVAAKDHERECEVCGGKPTVHPTELCGPCCFGEAATINGNWEGASHG